MIYADYTLNISGGLVEVTNSYEGLEGNVINVSGGETYVSANDDGVNATNGKTNALVNVTGGYLDVEVPTNGDTDGIDSNKDYKQSGGVVIVKGPGSASGQQGGGAAALDTDGTVTLTSGTLAVFGSIEKTPSTSLTKSVNSNTLNAGKHTISFSNNTKYTTNLKNSSKGCVVYSSLGTATIN